MLPNVNNKILDGALGLQPAAATGVFGVVGVAAKYTPNSIKIFTDVKDAAKTLGSGPLCDLVVSVLSIAKTTIYAIAIQGTQAGSVSIVSKGAGVISNITVAGQPRNDYNIKIEMLMGGGLNVATFRYMVDNVTGGPVTVPDGTGEFVVPDTGLTITFSPSPAYQAGDTFTFSTTAPAATNQEILDALDKLINSNYQMEFTVVAGITASPLWAALAVKMQQAADKYKYMFVICQARYMVAETADTWIAALTGAERGTVTSIRLQVCAGNIEEIDAISGQVDVRPIIGQYCGMLSRRKEHEPVDAVKYGSITVASAILPDDLNDGHIESLNDAGYVTVRQIAGLTGLYVTSGRLMSETGSDYNVVERIRVMNAACRQVRLAQLRYLNDTTYVAIDGSQEGLAMFKVISEQPLKQMETNRQISKGEVIISEGQDILATETIQTKIRITPLCKMSYIENEISFYNPKTGGE